MPNDLSGVLILLVSVAVTFFVSRTLSSGWRKRRREREKHKARAAETRQVRRARERREGGS